MKKLNEIKILRDMDDINYLVKGYENIHLENITLIINGKKFIISNNETHPSSITGILETGPENNLLDAINDFLKGIKWHNEIVANGQEDINFIMREGVYNKLEADQNFLLGCLTSYLNEIGAVSKVIFNDLIIVEDYDDYDDGKKAIIKAIANIPEKYREEDKTEYYNFVVDYIDDEEIKNHYKLVFKSDIIDDAETVEAK